MADHPQPSLVARRRLWRSEGRVARSPVVSFAAVLAAGVIGLYYFGGGFVLFCRGLATDRWHAESLGSTERLTEQLVSTVVQGLAVVAPILILCAAVAVMTELLQTGLLFTPKRLQPDFRRLSPSSGLRRYGRAEHWMAVLGTLSKATAILLVGAWAAWSESEGLGILSSGSTETVATASAFWLGRFARKLVVGLIVVGLFDFAVRRWRYERALRKPASSPRKEPNPIRAASIVDTQGREQQRENQLADWKRNARADVG